MKNIILLLATLFCIGLTSCDGVEDDPKPEEPQSPFELYLKELKGYNIKDTVGIEWETVNRLIINDSEPFIITGIKQNKFWFCLYDNVAKREIVAINGTKDIERTRDIHFGYGEYRSIDLQRVACQLLKTEWGYAVTSLSYYESYRISDELLLINRGNVYSYPLEQAESWKGCFNWYNGSIILQEFLDNEAYTYTVISPEGEKIEVFEKVPPFDSILKFISYSDIIVNSFYGYDLSRYDFGKDEYIWYINFRNYVTIQSHAQVSPTYTDKDANTIACQLDVLNYDGSKEVHRLEIDINTGAVKVL
jgi:hypothetical protein